MGLPVVHAAVAARTFNGLIYAGNGQGNPTCWCADTFTPGTQTLTLPEIGKASFAKTGFGDLLLRFKGTVLQHRNAAVALGADVRFPTGDEQNFLGTGATSFKPFVAVSLYSKPMAHNIVFAPHVNVGWQFIGKSVLGGELQGSTLTAQAADGSTISYVGAPFTATKDYLPDVFSWAVGTEVAFGRRNTVVRRYPGQSGRLDSRHSEHSDRIDSRSVLPDCTNRSVSAASHCLGYDQRRTGFIRPVQRLFRLQSAHRRQSGAHAGRVGTVRQ